MATTVVYFPETRHQYVQEEQGWKRRESSERLLGE